ncbi:MAG: glucose/mannose-6-phosphate isomerase [Thermoleophilaceae bacterium]|nr:glucose/mannose-6-phosphate isomerase [Thermoleophilaceae bacterium]
MRRNGTTRHPIATALASADDPLAPWHIAAADSYALIDDVLAQPDHLVDAMRRLERFDMPEADLPDGLVVCGMGGSAIGADLATAAIGARARRPLRTVRDYSPDPWLAPDTLVLCASYSGNTEETLACYAAAGAAGAQRVALTTGGTLGELARADGVPVIGVPAGLQPRAAVAYMTTAVLECAHRCGAAPDMSDEVHHAAALLAHLGDEWGPDAAAGSLAKSLAGVLHGTIPVIYGAELTAPVARRWKAQINENAKVAAFNAELPESDHNEICAWERCRGQGPFAAVFLDDAGMAPRNARRLELTSRLVAPSGAPVETVQTRGRMPLERLMSLVFLGDLVSVYLAVLDGIDPTPVEQIERFKRALA